MKWMKSGLRWSWIIVAVLAFDHWTKKLALAKLIYGEPLELTSFFNLTLSFNKGAAFSFLAEGSGWQLWFLSALAVIVSIILLRCLKHTSHKDILNNLAYTYIIGGALGNCWDRAIYGSVVDFLDFHIGMWHWPVFNFADTFICLGAILLIYRSLRS